MAKPSKKSITTRRRTTEWTEVVSGVTVGEAVVLSRATCNQGRLSPSWSKQRMQKLAEVCIRQPVFAAMLILALVVIGIASYFRLGRSLSVRRFADRTGAHAPPRRFALKKWSRRSHSASRMRSIRLKVSTSCGRSQVPVALSSSLPSTSNVRSTRRPRTYATALPRPCATCHREPTRHSSRRSTMTRSQS